jgi:ABC transporter substrate binding protein
VSIGYLVLAPLSETPSPERTAFLAGLRELGWIEGKTIAVEYRSAKLNVELLDYLAEELVRTKVDIIVAAGPDPLIKAAKQATSTIPIVMTGGSDPVAERFVASLARPGGNVTGVSLMTPELGSKRLELLKEVVPRVGTTGCPHDAFRWVDVGIPRTRRGLCEEAQVADRLRSQGVRGGRRPHVLRPGHRRRLPSRRHLRRHL